MGYVIVSFSVPTKITGNIQEPDFSETDLTGVLMSEYSYNDDGTCSVSCIAADDSPVSQIPQPAQPIGIKHLTQAQQAQQTCLSNENDKLSRMIDDNGNFIQTPALTGKMPWEA